MIWSSPMTKKEKKRQKHKFDYKKLASDAEKIIKDNFDFLENMELKLPFGSEPVEFTQEEAQNMARLLTDLHAVIHCNSCTACGVKYLKK